MGQLDVSVVISAIDKASDVFETVSDKVGGLSGMLTKSYPAALKVSAAALAGLGIEMKVAIDAFSESQQVVTQTEAVLKSTGGVAGVTADQVEYLAGRFQRLTGISDETVQSGENMLLTFTNIGKDVFPQATETMLDMSVALGQDVKGSAIQLGKALQDPILGVTALRRVGVNFTEDQQKMIESLVNSGKSLDAQKFILKELQTEFGGSAKAAGTTFKGQLDILKNTVGDLQEEIGKKLVGALQSNLIPRLQETADEIKNVIGGESTLTDLTKTLTDQFGSFGNVLGKTVETFGKHKDLLVALGGAFGGILAIGVGAAAVAFAGFIGLSLPVIAIAGGIGAAIALLVKHWGDIKNAVKTAGETLGSWVDNMKTKAGELKDNIGNAIESAKTKFEEFKQGVSDAFTSVVDWFQNLPQTISDAFTAAATFLNKFFFEDIPYAVGYALGRLNRFFTEDIPAAWEAMKTFFTQKVPEIANNLVTGFTDMGTRAGEAFSVFVTQTIPQKWEELKSSTATKAGEMAASVKTWFDQMVVDAVAAVTGLPAKISAAFETLKTVVSQKAKDVYDGAFEWFRKIGEWLDNIYSKATNALSKATEAFQKGFEAGNGGHMQTGGVVPGSGAVPMTVHGGELVLNRGQQMNLFRMIQSGANTGGGSSPQIHMGQVTIQSPMDLDQVMRGIGFSLRTRGDLG